jgi:hypothetical protein
MTGAEQRIELGASTLPGPIARQFFRSRGRVDAIMGPIGSGKTTVALQKILAVAAQAPRSKRDGVRRHKHVSIRDNYRRLRATVIESWFKVAPGPSVPGVDWQDGGHNAPSVYRLRLANQADGSIAELVHEFRAIGDQDVEQFCRGFETTTAFVNEVDTLNENLLAFLIGRCGRFPSPADVDPGRLFYGVWADLNAPDTDSWFYRDFVETPRPGYRLFVQPSGLSPAAENIKNLPPGYYEEQAKAQADWWVQRFIRNAWGFARDGKPVYPEFSDRTHVAAADLVGDPRLVLRIGLDAGATPAAVIGQQTPSGQWRLLDELVVPDDETMGPSRFGRQLADLLTTRYPRFEADGWGDPAAAAGADRAAGELDWLQIVAREAGIRVRPAPLPSNNLHIRLEAVRRQLQTMIDGDMPGVVVSPRCKVLRRGFNSGYRYRRQAIAGGARHEDRPEKNHWSHVHDALQYLMLGSGGFARVMGRAADGMRVEQPAGEYDPFAW